MDDVQQRVLSAAKDTAKSSTKPKKYRDTRDQVFRTCSNHNKLNEKVANRLKKTLKKDPSLILARSRGLGVSCPDGNTPLMACAMANQVDAANIVLEAAEVASTTMDHPKAAQALRELHLHRDLEGRCALSIASETGSVDMVQVLLPLYDIPLPSIHNERTAFMSSSSSLTPPPIDLLGRTPLARAMTSPNPKARSNRKLLEDTLFSPMDPSILGESLPLTERMHVYSSLHMAYGTADMPGKRILMEDSICAETWCSNNQEYSLLGVCDGHGDDGKVSEFVAHNVSGVLRECMEGTANDQDTVSVEYWMAIWHRTCLQVDDKLKAADLDGGSTAILALITKDLIVVANVGDSRCVLIQTAPQEAAAANETIHGNDDNTKPSVEQSSGETSEAPALKDETTPVVAAETPTNTEEVTHQLAQMSIASTADKNEGTVVTPLSFDHKPELPKEKARVEKAGLTVATNTYKIDGKEVTYHKIAKSEKDMVATSRSFGDFEYKQNPTLGPEEQAVSCVADVQVHMRDKDRDLYLVLACDGVWDVMENNQLMDFVVKEVKNKTEAGSAAVLPDVGDALVWECLALGSTDNMSAVLVSLQPEAQQIVSSTASDLPPPKALEFGSSPGK
jgi:serine/threonine protein phosphatase PrpC